MDVIIFPTDGPPRKAVAETYEDDDSAVSVNWLYGIIKCERVEVIYIPEGELWFDEEGKYKRPLVSNEHANRHFQKHLFAGDFLAGICVLVPTDVGLFNVLIKEA